MVYPLIAEDDGVKFKPELMEQEKMYHCVFKDKVVLAYKDVQDVLNCYEIEEKQLVEQVKRCTEKDQIEKILEDYVKKENLNN
jgi:hypothetical protein